MDWTLYPIKEMQSKWEDWDRLNGLYYNYHPYFDSRFIRPCVKYFGNNSIRLAELKNSTKDTIGMTLVKPDKIYGSWSLFQAPQMQISPLLLPKENNSKELHKLLWTLSRFCWRLECLYQDPEYSPFKLKQNGLLSSCYHCTTTSIDLSGSFDQFWKKRKKNLKKNMTRYFNRIKKENKELKLAVRTKPSELKTAVLRYGFLESSGWKNKTGTAIHPQNTQGRFYDEIMQNFSLTNQATVFELYINDELGASRLCINNDEMSIILKVTYNEQLSHFSPGKILLYKMVEREFEKHTKKKLEFYTNASKEQIDWASSTRDIFHFDIYKNKLLKKALKLRKGSQ